jgi:uncharacterized protein
MALAQWQELLFTPAEIVEALATARTVPELALRQAVISGDVVMPAVLDVVELAANRVYLVPKQEYLLFWGIHALAAARKTELYRPLLRLVRGSTERDLDRLLGDVTTETLPGVFLSVFDGDATSLVEACTDVTVDGIARWILLEVLARLTFDNRVPRQQTIDLLTRFEREQLAKAGDPAWQGWQEAIVLLGIEELRERLHATWEDGRNPQRKVDRDYDDLELSKARAMAPGDPTLFLHHKLAAIDDPVAALAWLAPKSEAARHAVSGRTKLTNPDPAEIIALNGEEIDWLEGFFAHVRARGLFEIIDGFFCGLIVGPGVAKPGEYLRMIWGRDTEGQPAEPRYENTAQEQYVANLLTRHWNTIARRLEGHYLHSLMLDETNELRAKYWSAGFFAAIAGRSEEWLRRRPGDDLIATLITGLMGLADREQILSRKLNLRQRAMLVEMMPTMLERTYDFWHEARDPLVQPRRFERLDLKFPRNAACPCGSGKKFKRCCGSAEKLVNT